MNIYLIRHTKTGTEKGLCYGQSDVPLSPDFPDAALQLQNKLPELNGDCLVFSSPLTRCRQLAEILSSKFTTDKRLLELNFGDWENRYFDEIEPNDLNRWTTHFVDKGPPNGESFTDLKQRCSCFWQDLLTLDSQQIVVVTHAGVIRALIAHILEIPLANVFQVRVDPGSVHKFQHENNYTTIDYLNR